MSAISTHSETAAPRSTPHSRRDTTRLVLAASIGNALEWFDLTAYGYFAVQTIGTFMMGFWPNYNTIGLAAPIGILCARLMQGFSVGGEFGSSTAFLVEHDASRKGLLSSLQLSSIMMIAALSVVTLVILRRRGVAS